MKRNYNKIFCIGMPKTGTKSLHSAFEALGFDSHHYIESYRHFVWNKGCYKWRYNFDALANIGEWWFPQLDKAYPNSKFILTIRNKEDWLESIKLHFAFRKKRNTSHVRIDIFGTLEFNEGRFSYIYDLHQKVVKEYFKNRENDFLILDICGGDGWDKLCNFLNMDIPDVEFPHEKHSGRRKKALKALEEKEPIKETITKKIDKYILHDKVFGIGLPCTGTKELNCALKTLKLKSIHDPVQFRKMIWNKGIYKTNDKFDALTNFGEWFFPQLDENYPNSKFILTIRNKEDWLKECEFYFSKKRLKTYKNLRAAFKKRIEIFGIKAYKKDQFSFVYDMHYKTVIDYFKNRKDDLLILDMYGDDGWERLCGFLGKGIPDINFPSKKKN